MILSEINAINAARENFLGLFAETLSDTPKYKNIQYLYDALESFYKASSNSSKSEFGENISRLRRWLEENPSSMNVANNLLAGYTRLFFTGKYSIGTTASYYISKKRVNKSDIWDEIMAFYRQNGFIPKKQLFDEDSAGTQIIFISILAGKAANIDNKEELLRNLAIQKEFYGSFVSIWIDMFCKNMIKASKDDSFFQIFGNLLADYIKIDEAIVNEMIDCLTEK